MSLFPLPEPFDRTKPSKKPIVLSFDDSQRVSKGITAQVELSLVISIIFSTIDPLQLTGSIRMVKQKLDIVFRGQQIGMDNLDKFCLL